MRGGEPNVKISSASFSRVGSRQTSENRFKHIFDTQGQPRTQNLEFDKLTDKNLGKILEDPTVTNKAELISHLL